MGESAAADADAPLPSRRARMLTIGAIVVVLALAAGWVVLAFTGDGDTSSTDVVSESTLPGYPTRGAEAKLDEQRPLVAAADAWRDYADGDTLQLPEGQAIELLWAGDVDSTKVGTSSVRASFSARLVILRSDNAVAALVRPLDGAGSGDDTAYSVLGTSSIATARYERGFTVATGVLLFNERMQRGTSLETVTFAAGAAPSLGETSTSDGLLLLASRSLLRIPDAGGSGIDVVEGFAYVHPSSGLTLLQTEDADGDWSAVIDAERGNARFSALSRGIITAREEEKGRRLRASILDDQTMPSGAPLSLVEVAHLENQGSGSGVLWAVVVATRDDDDPTLLGAGPVASPVNGAPQLPVIAAKWLRDDGVDVLVVAGSKGITSFEVEASGGTTSRNGSSGVLERAALALTWEDAPENNVTRPALVVVGRSGAGPVQPLEPVS
ncbi:hypothetical protein [Pseudoclavibacter terrae]|uniref:hypothetical protein n=1 Tax=Pseudoclavibacter terrae TaxID=1530195 RepID=UPI00233039B9|nr:hypothetical protein [Pseudoclavibacter terrae]